MKKNQPRWYEIVGYCLASILGMTACAGTDETEVDYTQDPTYLPEHPEEMFYFDEVFGPATDNGPIPSDTAGEDSGGDYGSAEQAFKNCWTGPGFAVRQGALITGMNGDYVPDQFGPCYQGTEPSHDCMFPDFRTGQTVAWEVNTSLNNANCSVDIPSSPWFMAGINPIGGNGVTEAAAQWAQKTGVNFVRTFFPNPGEPAPQVSHMCAPPAYQDSHPQMLGAAGPWGPAFLNGRPSQWTPLNGGTSGAQASLGANYPIQNPQGRIMYDGATYWIADRNMSRMIERCGGTLTQRKNKMRTLYYLVSLHEWGHVFGFYHTLTGPMRESVVCEELGDGNSSTSPRPQLFQGYGDVYHIFGNNLIFPAVPSSWFPDGPGCNQAPAPLRGSSSSPENVYTNDLN